MKRLGLFVFFFLASISFESLGAQIKKIKDGKVLIYLQKLDAMAGEELVVIDSLGSEIARVSIKQVKNDRAIGLVVGGTPTIDAYVIRDRGLGGSDGYETDTTSSNTKGWFLGAGYNMARPRIEGKGFTASTGENIDLALEYSPATYFDIGYVSAYTHSLGFFFSLGLEAERSLSSLDVTPGYSHKGQLNSASVRTSHIDLGATYGLRVWEQSLFLFTGISKLNLTFSLPGVHDISGSELGVFGGVGSVFLKHYLFKLNYTLVHKSETSGDAKVEFDFSGVAAGISYLF
ncbi:hypothetical protein [Bdellovibrio sp.]|uniref:hypothetical protein n=1 Tax=Bdellovibrio sp. TaxID=28201 RepID=UPI0039E56F6D